MHLWRVFGTKNVDSICGIFLVIFVYVRVQSDRIFKDSFAFEMIWELVNIHQVDLQECRLRKLGAFRIRSLFQYLHVSILISTRHL